MGFLYNSLRSLPVKNFTEPLVAGFGGIEIGSGELRPILDTTNRVVSFIAIAFLGLRRGRLMEIIQMKRMLIK